ncbi:MULTISPECIES: small multi-drug export protein [unclassified Treponema]|uniref:COG2426 family protein n=1 Tax=unclassified Treponema TaxID=2638727 RepID=UPI0025D58D27|nr:MULTISPECIES: small multi-drug export protein [unclassified Treponema]MBQ8679677.1 small multi-drug export protein [Treponema sp.]
MTKALLISFFVSMIPLIELRGAIPVGLGLFASQGIELSPAMLVFLFIACMVGNMLPVPFIFLFARKFLEWGQEKKLIGGICRFCLEKGHRGGEKLQEKAGRGLYFALFLFVGIPLPGTGAWTGTLAASLLDMDWKKTTLSVIFGVLLAGVIMMTLSFGVASGVGAVTAQ